MTDTTRRRRVVEVVAFVAVWVVAGYALPISSNGYLLLGIPLTIAFQLLVRRRPLRELFAPGTMRFTLDGPGRVIAAVLAAVPVAFAMAAAFADDWVDAGWYLAAIVGAVCAAYALRNGSVPSALRSAALPLAFGSTGMAAVYSGLHFGDRHADLRRCSGDSDLPVLGPLLPGHFPARGGLVQGSTRRPRAP